MAVGFQIEGMRCRKCSPSNTAWRRLDQGLNRPALRRLESCVCQRLPPITQTVSSLPQRLRHRAAGAQDRCRPLGSGEEPPPTHHDRSWTLPCAPAAFVNATVRARSVLATRKPRLLFRFVVVFLLRLAERTFLGLLFQEPPRTTRRGDRSGLPRGIKPTSAEDRLA